MVARKVASVAVLFALFVSGLPAGARVEISDYPPRKAADCAFKAEKSGLTVGIQPMEDVGDQKNFFGTDLHQKGFAPVYVVIENRSDADSFLFDKGAVKINANAGNNLTSKGADTMEALSVASMSMVGIFVALKMEKDHAMIQTNMVKKELQSKTLSPGGTASGFLYLSAPRSGTRAPVHLTLFVTRSGDDTPLSLDFDF